MARVALEKYSTKQRKDMRDTLAVSNFITLMRNDENDCLMEIMEDNHRWLKAQIFEERCDAALWNA